MNAGVPLLKVLLDDSPRALKHKFQSIIVPRRCLSVRPPVSTQPSTGTNMFSIEISAYLLAPRIENMKYLPPWMKPESGSLYAS
jgi:hypothetical protein